MPAVPFILAATAVVSTGYSIYAGERQAKENKKAVEAQRRGAQLAQAREKRDAIRAARGQAAAVAQASETQGVSGSSAALGGQASIGSQLSSNLSFLDQSSKINDQASQALGNAQAWGTRSNSAAAVAGLAVTATAHSSEINAAIKKVFKLD